MHCSTDCLNFSTVYNLNLTPNLHCDCKGVTDALLKWHLGVFAQAQR